MYIFRNHPDADTQVSWIEQSLQIGDCFDVLMHCKLDQCLNVYSVLEQYGIILSDSSKFVLVQFDTGFPWIASSLMVDEPNPLLTSLWAIWGNQFSMHLFTSDGSLYALLTFEDSFDGEWFHGKVVNCATRLIDQFPEIDFHILISQDENGRQGIFHAANSLKFGCDYFRFFHESPKISFLMINEQTALGSYEAMQAYHDFVESLCEQLFDEHFDPVEAATEALLLFRRYSAASIESLHRQMQSFSILLLNELQEQSIIDHSFLKKSKIDVKIMHGDSEASYIDNLSDVLSQIYQRHIELSRQFNISFLRKVSQYIDQNIDSVDLSVSKIAAEFNTNRSQLTANFRAYYGQSLLEYIRSKRIQRAIVLIRAHPNRSLEQIAEESGYCNQSTMYRAFQQFGLGTPSKYRAERHG